MPRPSLIALPLLTGALLALPAGAAAKPQLRLEIPKVITSPKLPYKTVVKGAGRHALVEIQARQNGLWVFETFARRGAHRGTLKVKGGLQEAEYRVAIRSGGRTVAAASKPRTVRYVGRVPFSWLFADAPHEAPGRTSTAPLFAPIDVPAERSACRSLSFDVSLAGAESDEVGTLTVTQAGRAPQAVTVPANQSVPLVVRLTPGRPYRIEPSTPGRPSFVLGEYPVLRINGEGVCFSKEPIVTA